MRLMHLTVILMLIALAGCASPPPPAMADESVRRPVNDAREIERLRCTSELKNTQIELSEALRTVERSNAVATQARLDAMRVDESRKVEARPAASQVFTVLFTFNAAGFQLSEADAQRLVATARSGEFIAVRGRTDGVTDTPGEARIARQRAEAMQTFLVRAGVDPTRIAMSYQPSGDNVAPNTDERGRALNRRVEVEVYAVRPARASVAVATLTIASGDRHE